MIIESSASDIIYTAAVSGVNANFLKPSLESMGITEEMWGDKAKMDVENEAKAWSTIWSAGQGVTTIKDCPSVKELIETTKKEFFDSIENQTKLLDKYS
jgi:nitronate monooxygenase